MDSSNVTLLSTLDISLLRLDILPVIVIMLLRILLISFVFRDTLPWIVVMFPLIVVMFPSLVVNLVFILFISFE
jgi:hypothetical protein